MLIVMESGFRPEDLETVVAKVEALGFKAHVIPGATSTAVGITGNQGPVDPRPFEVLAGVKQAIPVTRHSTLSRTPPERIYPTSDSIS